MSYSGSQQQYEFSDMQLLQQHVMLARLQELQKQQQHGQLGDVSTASSVHNMSLFSKQAARAQFQNVSSGTSIHASAPQMFGSSNMNWMSYNVSSPMQGLCRGSPNSHDKGVMMNPTLQQPDVSLYGMPVASGRGNIGQSSPMDGIFYNSNGMLAGTLDQKPVTQASLFANSFMGDNQSVGLGNDCSLDKSFMLKQGSQEKVCAGQASFQTHHSRLSPQISLQMNTLRNNAAPHEYNRIHRPPGSIGFLQEQAKLTNNAQDRANLDPLEEKILFDTEGSGWDTSFSKLAAISIGDSVSSSVCTENNNAFSSVHSGSWSALMHSAVAEASSSDTAVQEELSGLSFQYTELSAGKQPSALATSGHQHGKWTDSKWQSSLYNPSAHRSAADSAWSGSQQQLNHPVTTGHIRNDWVALNDVSQGSKSTLPVSGFARNNYGSFEQPTEGHIPLPGIDGTMDHKGDRNIRHHRYQLSGSPMAVDTHVKRTAGIYETQNSYSGGNSSDSYNSKVSQSHRAEQDHPCSNAEDSESSGRCSHKSQKQALFMSFPGANSHQDFLRHVKSANLLPTNANSTMKEKPNQSSDGFSKGSPASDTASFDSQYISELTKANPPRGHRSVLQFGFTASQTDSQESDMPNASAFQGKPNPDLFSFQSSVKGDVSLGNGKNGRTWWTPSSFRHSFPPSQEASLAQNWSGNSSIMGRTVSEISYMNNEKNSHAASSGSLYMNNQLEGKQISSMSVAFEPIRKTYPETGQRMSLSSYSPSQDMVSSKSISSFGHEYSVSGAFPITQSQVTLGMNHQSTRPLSLGKNVPNQGDVIADSEKVLSNLNTSLTVSDASHIATSSSLGMPERSSLASVPVWSSETGKAGSKEQSTPVIQNFDLKGLDYADKYLRSSADASMLILNSIHQQDYITTGQTDRNSCGITAKPLHACTQPSQSHNFIIKSIKKQMNASTTANTAEAGVNKVDYDSSAVANLNKMQISEVNGQQPLHTLSHNPSNGELNGALQFNPPSANTNTPAFLSAASSSLLENASSLSALQYIYSHKLPLVGQSDPTNHATRGDVLSEKIRYLQIKAQTAPAWYTQHDYTKDGKMLPLSDSTVISSVKPSDKRWEDTTSATRKSDILPGLPNHVSINETPLPSSMIHSEDNTVALRKTKKRKAATYDFLPWHKKVLQTCQGLPDISTADLEWEEATNRLIEKCVDEGEANKELWPSVRAKKRLILTTQLMQQVFRPPPSIVLPVNARTEYEIVAYSAVKSALADACSLANNTGTCCGMPSKYVNLAKNSRTIVNLFSKATEELVERINKLESQLDRSFSVVDVRVECQDLVKFCVINHFAKYHSRVVRVDSGSSTTGVASFRPFLQRYVTAVPLPQKLPEGVQCLSL